MTVSGGDARARLTRWALNYRDFPARVSDHRALRALRTWLTLGSPGAVVVVAAAGPERMFPDPMTAATVISWLWLLVWCTIATALAGRLLLARLRTRSRRENRVGRVDSMWRAMSLAEDMLRRQSRRGRHEELWCSVAVAPLAALLYTASPKGNGLGLAWLATLTGPLCDEHSAAGWRQAAALTDVDALFSSRVSDIGSWDARQRASLGVTIRDAVADELGVLR
jgi:hypothetical protein